MSEQIIEASPIADSSTSVLKSMPKRSCFVNSLCPAVDLTCRSKHASNLTQQQVARHAKLYHEENSCTICQEELLGWRNFARHMLRIHKQAQPRIGYPCKQCFLQFKDSKSLKRHFCNPESGTLSAEHLRPVVIGAFDTKFRSSTVRGQNTTDVEAVATSGKYRCEHCNKFFNIKGSWVDHLRVHTKMKPFSCQYCTKSFSIRKSLVVHERRHTGEKPYGCPLCPKRFVDSGEVKNHVRFHTQEKPFKCDFPNCGKGFARKGHLTQHVRTHGKGGNDTSRACRVCFKSFSSLANCTRHEQDTHEYFKPREGKGAAQVDVKRVPKATEPRHRTKEEIEAAKIKPIGRPRTRTADPRPAKQRKTKKRVSKHTKSKKVKTAAVNVVPDSSIPAEGPGKNITIKEEAIETPEPEPETELHLDFVVKEEFITGCASEFPDITSDSLHCPYCQISFTTYAQLENHATFSHGHSSDAHGGVLFKCLNLNCSDVLNSFEELRVHLITEHYLNI